MIRPVSLVIAAGVAVCGCGGGQSNASAAGAAQRPRAQFVREIAWSQSGRWITADLHTHTTFSDGSHAPIEVARKAIEFGCQALAIADHGDHDLRAATPEYAAAIADIRRRHPELVTVAGLEWNVPPYAGREHVTVLMPSGPAELDTLRTFKERFDDYERADHASLSAEAALKWLGEQKAGAVPPVVVYNHPSRKDKDSLENINDIERWRAVNSLVVGFEGGPGHQKFEPIGAYEDVIKTVNRWDPVAGTVGDAWDRLLGKGADLTAALASSDLHNANDGDPWPCEFSETRLFVPEPTVDGVLRALRASATYAGHGKFLSSMELTVRADGLARPAMIGESIRVTSGAPLTARIRFDLAAADSQKRPGRVSRVQMIGVTAEGASVIREWKDADVQPELETPLQLQRGGLTVRAVVSRDEGENQPALMYLTSPIRISPF